MNTFLPYPDFSQSAQCLDRQRLGKQRVEVYQLLKALFGHPSRWINHPACRMWKGYEYRLGIYGLTICEEWVRRGYKDSCADKINVLMDEVDCSKLTWPKLPPWFGDDAFHAAHRSNLLRKDPIHYSQFGWTESDNLPYVWPVPKE